MRLEVRVAWSHAGSHTDERLTDSPDSHEQPTRTRPRSQTVL